jgi:hypothetical protein
MNQANESGKRHALAVSQTDFFINILLLTTPPPLGLENRECGRRDP